MALLAQWVRQRPWLAAGIAGAAGGIAGIAHGVAAMASTASALAFGGISTKRQSSEHPFRSRVLRTLERHPGLCYRELQHELSAANGTLRHHLDVMQNQGRITVMPVNGRTCYFAGGRHKLKCSNRFLAIINEWHQVFQSVFQQFNDKSLMISWMKAFLARKHNLLDALVALEPVFTPL